MNIQYYLLLALITLNVNNVLAEELKKPELKNEIKAEKELKLTFRANKTNLWFKHEDLKKDKKAENIVEATLPGKMYEEPILIVDVDKNNISRTTPEQTIASYFSASKKGDVDWIIENFLSEEKEKMRTVFGNKKTLKESQKGIKSIKTKKITGETDLKDCKIVFVEENYGKNKIVMEPLALKKEGDEWKITNILSEDKTFDIVFAAVSSGEIDDGKPKNKNNDINARVKPAIIEFKN